MQAMVADEREGNGKPRSQIQGPEVRKRENERIDEVSG
jgi:hypothetical protein